MTRKKKGSKTKTSLKKSHEKANLPKKQAGRTPNTIGGMKCTDAKKEAGKGSSASIKASSAKKTCNKKSPNAKAAKKSGKLSTNKEKRGKRKVVTGHMLEGTDRSISLVQEKIRLLRILTAMMIRVI